MRSYIGVSAELIASEIGALERIQGQGVEEGKLIQGLRERCDAGVSEIRNAIHRAEKELAIRREGSVIFIL